MCGKPHLNDLCSGGRNDSSCIDGPYFEVGGRSKEFHNGEPMKANMEATDQGFRGLSK